MKKRISVKKTMLIVSAVLLIAVAIGTTTAFLVDETPPLTNTFQPVSVSCAVQESFDPTTNLKKDVSVKNTGDIPAYVRATVVVTWVSEDGNTTYGGAPVAGVHYTVVMGQNGWQQGSDGFYYCTAAVEAGGTTPILLASATPVAGQAPEGYRLSVQIVASAIQADPAEAVTSAWSGVTVRSDGTITAPQ